MYCPTPKCTVLPHNVQSYPKMYSLTLNCTVLPQNVPSYTKMYHPIRIHVLLNHRLSTGDISHVALTHTHSCLGLDLFNELWTYDFALTINYIILKNDYLDSEDRILFKSETDFRLLLTTVFHASICRNQSVLLLVSVGISQCYS